MSGGEENRQCPLCDNSVPLSIEGITVSVLPGIKRVLHDGCAKMIYDAWIEAKEPTDDAYYEEDEDGNGDEED